MSLRAKFLSIVTIHNTEFRSNYWEIVVKFLKRLIHLDLEIKFRFVEVIKRAMK